MPISKKAVKPREKKKAFTLENTRIVIEVLAILATGVWAIFNFIIRDNENFNASIETSSKLTTEDFASVDKKYLVDYSLTVQNIGSHLFNIDSIKVSYWIFPNAFLDSSVYFNIDDIIAKYPCQSKVISAGSLINPYNIKQSRQKDFIFSFDSIQGRSIAIMATCEGHYRDYLYRNINCESECYTWMYDCWNKTKNYRSVKKIPLSYSIDSAEKARAVDSSNRAKSKLKSKVRLSRLHFASLNKQTS